MASITKYEGKRGTTYKVTIRIAGRPTVTESFKRLSDAKQWARDTEFSIRSGLYFKTIKAKNLTLEDVIDRYRNEVLPDKPKSCFKQDPQLMWWKSKIGKLTLADVDRPTLIVCINELSQEITYRGTKRSGATVNRYLAALSHVFSKAVEWELITESPTSKIKRKKETPGRTRFLSDDERHRLLDACKSSHNSSLHLIVVIAISTGARYSEIMNLTWKDVMFERNRLILKDTKNSETRSAPLVGSAFDLMKAHRKIRRIDSELVFPRKGCHNDKHIDIRTSWENAVNVAKIDDFKFHDLRHTAASYLAMNGATLAELAEILGHKTLAMVKRYAHLTDHHVSGVVERMNKQIFK